MDCIYNTAELSQQAIAHQLEDATVVLFDLWLEELFAVGTKPFERAI
jgi:hypothetical protein